MHCFAVIERVCDKAAVSALLEIRPITDPTCMCQPLRYKFPFSDCFLSSLVYQTASSSIIVSTNWQHSLDIEN